MFTRFALSALALAASARAIVTPTSPDSATVVKVGANVTALWDVDTTGSWTNLEIQLMTGANLAMVALATVASGIDGTTATSYSFVAPDVTPNSEIYFLQFTNGGDMSNVTWTTRFTIAGADGSTTEPTNSTTTDGATVNWGTGELVGSSSNTTTAVASSSSSASASAASTSSAASASSTSASASATDSTSASAASSTSAASTAAATTSVVAAAASSTTSGAGRVTVALGGAVVGIMGLATLLVL